jgi:hypothetical protein
MTRLRTTIAATLLAAVALIAPAASHAADSELAGTSAYVSAQVQLGDGELLVTAPSRQLLSMLGWGWGG